MAKRKTPQTNTSKIDDPVTAYAQDVVDGKIVAGPHVRNSCRRHLQDLENGHERGLVWDPAAANRFIGYCRDVLRLNGGQFDGKPFILHESQKFKYGSIFGWKRKNEDGKLVRRFRRAYIEEAKGNGKALALDTPIPTLTGWSTMGELDVGDAVLDERGQPTLVIGTSNVMHGHDCYEVEFDDGSKITADAEHLWLTEQRRSSNTDASALKGVNRSEYGKWRNGVRTTREIAETLRYSNGKYQSANHSIQLTEPLDLPTAILPVHPYVLGVWLGDGDSDCARFTCADNDNETVDNLVAVGCDVGVRKKGGSSSGTTGRYRLGSAGNCGSASDKALTSILRRENLILNKHIPAQYLRASIEQRLDLMRGLMDTDGYIDKIGICEFTTISKALAAGFYELAVSLGLKVSSREGIATLYGREISPKWRIQFCPPSDMKVFSLQRKVDRQVKRHNRRPLSDDRKIVNCTPVQSVPVKCIKVASANSLFLAGRSMIPTHNSPGAAAVGLYCMTADGEQAAEIYAAGKDKGQAFVLYRDAVAMYEQSPALKARLTASGGNPVWNLADLRTRSFFRPLSRDGAHSGPRPSVALVDELHEHPDSHTIEMLERGFKFRDQPILFMITNSGSDRNSVCYAEHEWAVKVAAGTDTPDEDFTYVGEVFGTSDETFSYVCALDKDDDPFDDPSCWVKANPLLGVTLKFEYIEGVLAQAKDIPSKRNNILRLHFCVWTESDTVWLPRPLIDKVMVDFDPEVEHAGKVITAAGLDLSGTKDLTAAGFIIETGTKSVKRADGELQDLPTYDLWIEAWTPGETIDERGKVDHVPYRLWADTFYPGTDKPYLIATEGKRVRYDHVAAHFARLNSEHGIRVLAYDKYAYDKFADEMDSFGVEIETVAHPQGGKRRAKPSDEKVQAARDRGEEPPQGLWMPGSVAEFEALILEERIRIRRSPVILTALMGVAMETDPLMGNQWFSKKKATVRIDPAVAAAMAIGAATDGFVPYVSKYADGKGFVEL